MIRFYHGFFFPLMSQICGGLLLIGAIFVTIEYPLFGIFLILFFGLSFAVHKGIEFDIERNRFRLYTIVYGLKFGQWLVLNEYPNICLLQRYYTAGKRHNKYKAFEFNEGEFNPDYSQIEIIITGADFRKKILVKTENTEERGRSEAERIAQLLGRSFVNYAPKRHPDNPRKKRKAF